MVSATDSQINICVSTAKTPPKSQHQKYDHDHLGNGFEFSPVVRGNTIPFSAAIRRKPLMINSRPMIMITTHAGSLPTSIIADHGRAYQKLVCQRIHKFSKIGNQVIFSGKMTVKPVRNTCCDKNQERSSGLPLHPILSERKLQETVPCIILATVSLFGVFIAQLSYQIILKRTCHTYLCKITCHKQFSCLNKKITVYLRCIPVGTSDIGTFTGTFLRS